MGKERGFFLKWGKGGGTDSTLSRASPLVYSLASCHLYVYLFVGALIVAGLECWVLKRDCCKEGNTFTDVKNTRK